MQITTSGPNKPQSTTGVVHFHTSHKPYHYLLNPYCHPFMLELVWSSSHQSTHGNTCTETQSSCESPHVFSSVLKLYSFCPPLVSPQTPPSTRQGRGGGRPSISGSSSGIFPERNTRSGCKEWPLTSRSPGKNLESRRCRIWQHHKWPKKRDETKDTLHVNMIQYKTWYYY